MKLEDAKEKLERLKKELVDDRILCLYISPVEHPLSGKFLDVCWYHSDVSPDKFIDALKDGFFERILPNDVEYDVFVMSQRLYSIIVNGSAVAIKADNYEDSF